MADKKISALTGASTPLAGTEVLPIVQSGSTVKVAVSDLTAGRVVDMTKVNVVGSAGDGYFTFKGGSTGSGFGTLLNSSNVAIGYVGNGGGGASNAGAATDFAVRYQTNLMFVYAGGSVAAATLDASSNLTLPLGNLVIGTSGKGIDFSATSGTGTSELLADYEEGTWTPTDASGAALSLTGTSTNCFYTKIGNQVTCIFSVTYPSTVSAASAILGGLPFTSKNTGNSVAGGITTYISNGSVIVFLISSNDTTINIRSISGISGVTNASLSTAQIRGIVQYLV